MSLIDQHEAAQGLLRLVGQQADRAVTSAQAAQGVDSYTVPATQVIDGADSGKETLSHDWESYGVAVWGTTEWRTDI